jgi:hypothetical protein
MRDHFNKKNNDLINIESQTYLIGGVISLNKSQA